MLKLFVRTKKMFLFKLCLILTKNCELVNWNPINAACWKLFFETLNNDFLSYFTWFPCLFQKFVNAKLHSAKKKTYISGKIWHFILNKAMLVKSLSGMLVYLCSHFFCRHAHFSTLHLFKKLRPSLKGQLIQRHVVITHSKEFGQLVFPGCSCLLG